MLCRLQAMLQAAAGDGLAFDPFAFEEDALGPSKIDVGGREIVEALVISGVIISLDESGDLPFEISRQIVMLQQDAVLERLMPALDLALRLGWVRAPAEVSLVFPPQATWRDRRPRMTSRCQREAAAGERRSSDRGRLRQRHVQRRGDVLRCHGRT